MNFVLFSFVCVLRPPSTDGVVFTFLCGLLISELIVFYSISGSFFFFWNERIELKHQLNYRTFLQRSKIFYELKKYCSIKSNRWEIRFHLRMRKKTRERVWNREGKCVCVCICQMVRINRRQMTFQKHKQYTHIQTSIVHRVWTIEIDR